MPELSEPLKQLKGFVGQIKALNLDLNDQKAREAIHEVVKDEYNNFYQSLVNLGFGSAQSRFEPQITTEKAAKEEALRQLGELKEAVKQKQDPDLKKLNEDWQAKHDKETGELKSKLATAESRVTDTYHERDEALLEAKLIGLDLPPTLAGTLARDRTLRDRRTYDEKGSLTVLQAGQRIPYSPGSGQTHLDLLANEIAEKPDIKLLRISRGDAGGGVTTGSSQGPAQGDKALYDNIRAEAKKEQQGDTNRKPLKERIKNR